MSRDVPRDEALAGDERLTELYREHGAAIRARCRDILRDPAAAEDATQETFVRVHRHIDRLPPPGERLPWIYRIAINYCLNELRDRKHRPSVPGDLPEPAETGVEASLVDRDLAVRVLSRTPSNLKPIIMLHYLDGLDQGKVAETLGVSRRTVVSRLSAFLKKARRAWSGDGGG